MDVVDLTGLTGEWPFSCPGISQTSGEMPVVDRGNGQHWLPVSQSPQLGFQFPGAGLGGVTLGLGVETGLVFGDTLVGFLVVCTKVALGCRVIPSEMTVLPVYRYRPKTAL